ncbi:nucleotide sugar dehydrogenase [Chloroflexota bacterium]
MKYNSDKAVVCIVGLGYIGLPLAEAFARSLSVFGFDSDIEKVNQMQAKQSESRKSTGKSRLTFTVNPEDIGKADFNIICVPTPINASKEPDLSHIMSAARVVGQNMKRGSVVVLESTVFPGTTEGIVKPILEEKSGMRCGPDFKIGYSPERINPGDSEHEIGEITKLVSGMDRETTEKLAQLYGRVTKVFITKDIKTAEAAEVIENIQRDINIALINELSLIFARMGLSTRDVLDAAVTKWNFQRYTPGLVGGHCIPVDPYYLVYKARELDYHPQVILAGRAINDFMPRHVAEMAIKALNSVGKVIKGSQVLIMGLTYKENVPDTRESPVKEIVKELKEFGVDVYGYDPVLEEGGDEFGVKLLKTWQGAEGIDAVIITVAHDRFRDIKLSELKKAMNSAPVLIDVRQIYNHGEAEKEGFYYKTL